MSLEEKIKDLKMKWFTFGVIFGLFFGFFTAIGIVLEYPDILKTDIDNYDNGFKKGLIDYTYKTEFTSEPPLQDRVCDYDEMRFETLIGDIYCMREVRFDDISAYDRILEHCSGSYFTKWDIMKDETILSCKFIYERGSQHWQFGED